ncbi:MAG TPA: tetratricopeptide repeat protein [Smithellaceae bacterium]|jgi:Tfp pilus assembly protein PilF|nr:tetratricopeptide repeat protein [Smithellaceae bacterium]HQF83562.1 tetratricopeptide repeat protein [Smithellaceae bacterium]HQG79546.1 tetratricopeptide repeat protein [Smithellaceae bacterium]
MLTKNNEFTLPVRFGFPGAKKYAFTLVTLLIVLLAVYANSFHGQWHFDDFPNIVENTNIRIKSFSFEEMKGSVAGVFTKRSVRPLAYLSFAANYKFGGLDVFHFHLVNFFIHYLAAVFLFLFIYNLLKLPLLKERYAHISYSVALIATTIWAVHPLHVSTVSYIVQRMSAMAALFYIMSMYFYLKARVSQRASSSFLLFALCILSALASFLSKENSALLPAAILLIELLLIRGASKDNLLKLGKFLILPLLFVVVIGYIYTGDPLNAFAGYAIRDFTPLERLLTQPRVILFYLSLLFYPVTARMTMLHDIPPSHSLFDPWTTLPALLIVVMIIGLAVYLARKRPLLSFCVLFYFLNHLIESTVLPLEMVYEHRNYLPSMLLFVPPAYFFIYLIDYFSYKKTIQFALAAGVTCLMILTATATLARNEVFADDFLLWTDNIQKTPDLSRPHANLGRIYFNSGERQKAIQEFEKALSLNRFDNKHVSAQLKSNIGIYYFVEGQNDLAMQYFAESARELPRYMDNIMFTARIHLRQDRIDKARQIIAGELKQHPDNAKLVEMYSFILLKKGEPDEARRYAQKYLSKRPDSPYPLMLMAEISRQAGNNEAAIFYWERAQAIEPENRYANLALIELYSKTGRIQLLEREIAFLLSLAGPLKLGDYIKELTKDAKLTIYIPRAEDFAFMETKCRMVSH